MVNIPKLKSNDGQVIINCEWGAFGDDGGLPCTKFDDILDKDSANQGKQRYEKMISGMYLGELFRITLVELMHTGSLFDGCANHLLEKEVLGTADMSAIEMYKS